MSSIRHPYLALTVAAISLLAPGNAVENAVAGVRISARTPSVALGGRPLIVRGRIHGGRARVRLERARRGRWVRVGRPHRVARRFSFRWQPRSRRAVLRLRVAAKMGRRGAVSRVMRVAIAPTTVLPTHRVLEAPAPGRRGQLRLIGRARARRGEFVALDAGPAAPNGLLARVADVRRDGGLTVLDLAPASLVDAVPEGGFRVAARVLRLSRRARDATQRDFNAPVGCSADVGAEVRGSLTVAVDPTLELEWSRGRVTSARAAAGLHGDAQLAAEVAARASCELEQTRVGRWYAPAIRAFVGPIPVVVVPRVTLYVSAHARTKAAAHTELHGYLSARAAIRYEHGDVRTAGSFEQGFSSTEPVARASAAVGARVVPSVEFLLYGEVGPRFDLSTGLQFDADPSADPWWQLVAPVELSAGLSIPHFEKLSIPQQPVFSRRVPLAQAPPREETRPEDAPTAAVQRARITWDSDATDVDLHVWDAAGAHASYESPDAIAGGRLSSDDRDGFGPEDFTDGGSASGTGPLTVGVCYFDDRGGAPATVDVEVTDADGSTRALTETLRAKGDGVIVESASGYTPPSGWCTGAP